MTAKPSLRVIEKKVTDSYLNDQPLDITRILRADIAKRDWSAVHISGDRRAPVYLPDRNRRLWRR
jgi:hypothetical protein